VTRLPTGPEDGDRLRGVCPIEIAPEWDAAHASESVRGADLDQMAGSRGAAEAPGLSGHFLSLRSTLPSSAPSNDRSMRSRSCFDRARLSTLPDVVSSRAGSEARLDYSRIQRCFRQKPLDMTSATRPSVVC
jgi:hypothetical protein